MGCRVVGIELDGALVERAGFEQGAPSADPCL